MLILKTTKVDFPCSILPYWTKYFKQKNLGHPRDIADLNLYI